ncbi:MAG TPA: hypothetical protein VM580_29540 [Labilithrix sp.]|nr:hypothetical protein [Labilithrix sp.]
MRNKQWLRYGLASLVLGGVGLATVLAACSDDDTTTPSTTKDSGTDSAAEDSGGQDSGGAVDSGTAAKAFLIHAATDLGPDTESDDSIAAGFTGGVRVCFATATVPNPTDSDFAPAPFPANPTDGGPPGLWPGLFIGTGGPLATSGADLEGITVRPYLLNAKALHDRGIEGLDPTVPRCTKILSDGGLTEFGGTNLELNTEYWQLADVPAGTLKKNHTYLLAVTGCTNNASNNGDDLPEGYCGNDDNGAPYVPDGGLGAGNLKVLILEMDNDAAPADDEIGAAAINLSPQQQVAKGGNAGLTFKPTLANSADGGTGHFPVVENYGEVTFSRTATTGTPVAKIKGLITAEGYFALSPVNDPNSGDLIGAQKLNNTGAADPTKTVQFATTADPSTTTELYVNGKAYTFALVGDPAATAGPRRMHYIGVPNKL